MSGFTQNAIRDGRPIAGSAAITPNDSTLIDATRAILVDVTGNVKVTYTDGDVDTVPLAARVWHPMSVVKIWFTGTTATGIHAGY